MFAATDSLDREQRLDDLIATYLEQAETGRNMSAGDWADRYPEFRDELRDFIDQRLRLEQLAAPLRAIARPALDECCHRLGDFQLLGEIGRGGMGIVYQAQQLSLNRRVALKVLPFAGMLDARQQQRFKNEAHAAAMLEHPHIVNVFFVGCERGVHFYAMRYVDGQSLAEAMAGARRPAAVAHSSVSPDHDTRPMAAFTTQYTADRRGYFRSVAQLGIQAAQALEYAHQMAVVHRDIKPSNLLLDSQGHLWVTDFGLATAQSNANLTMTGDVVGTLRYMSPEQAAGKSAILDHRTDIYSLGITLYELLTLQPAFPEQDPQTLLHRILGDEPVPPRKLNASIPIDLQTIVVKAIAKSPADRYASAQALADDLQRFLERRPITARPLGRIARTWRWCKRSPAFAGVVTAAFGLLLCVAAMAVLFALRETTHRQQAEAATEEAYWQQYLSDMHSAMAAWEQSDIGRTLELLERHRPKQDEPDQRGFEWHYLWRQCQDKRLKVVLQETSSVLSVAFSHNRRMLATGNYDGLVRIWDTSNGWLKDEFKEFPLFTCRVAFSPDDRILASANGEGMVRIRKIEDSRMVRDLAGHKGQIKSLLFSPDGKQLVSCAEDPSIRIWDVTTGRELKSIRPAENKPARPVLVGPWNDNRLWVFGPGAEGALRVLSGDNGFEVRSLPRKELSQYACVARVSWNERLGATAGADGIIRLFDTETGDDIETLGGHGNAVRSLSFAPDDQTLASSDAHGKVIVWDLAQRARRAVLRGPYGPGWPIAFSDDGQLLCTSGIDHKVRVWDVSQQTSDPDVIQAHDGFVLCVAFSTDGRMMASGGADAGGGLVKLWDVATGRRIGEFKGHTAWVHSVAFSPDGHELASTGEDGTIRLWNLNQGKLRAALDTGNAQWVSWASYSHDGRQLVSSERDGTLRVWDRDSAVEIRSAKIGQSGTWTPAISADGRSLVVGVDGAIVWLELPSLKTIRRIPQSPSFGSDVALSPDGRTMATCIGSNVRLSSLDGVSLGTLSHAANVQSTHFSPDGRSLVTAGHDHDVHIWDVERQAERATLRGHFAWIDMVRFSPNGKTIASTSDDGTIRLWRSTPPD